MDFAMTEKGQDYHKRLTAFMTEFVFPAEESYDRRDGVIVGSVGCGTSSFPRCRG